MNSEVKILLVGIVAVLVVASLTFLLGLNNGAIVFLDGAAGIGYLWFIHRVDRYEVISTNQRKELK